MKKLAVDHADHRRQTGAVERKVDTLEESMDSQFDALRSEMQGLQKTSQAMADAMMQAIKQLGVDKSVEARVARLEAAVFGAKH